MTLMTTGSEPPQAGPGKAGTSRMGTKIMRGRWEKIRGTIVESADAPPGATKSTMARSRQEHDYVVEVQDRKGGVLRATVGMAGFFVHAVGEPMAVEVNFKTGEVRLDRQAEAAILRQQAETMRVQASMGLSASAVMGSPVTADGSGTAEDRLAQLRQLHDKGILTDSEYQARRAEIIGQI